MIKKESYQMLSCNIFFWYLIFFLNVMGPKTSSPPKIFFIILHIGELSSMFNSCASLVLCRVIFWRNMSVTKTAFLLSIWFPSNKSKNPAYGTLFCTFGHFLVFSIAFLALFVTFLANVKCHMSLVTCHMSHITCHMSHRPSPADSPLSTVDWFQIQKKP